MKTNDKSIKHLKVAMGLASYPTEQLIQELLYRFMGETESYIINPDMDNENYLKFTPALEKHPASTGFARYNFTFWTTNN